METEVNLNKEIHDVLMRDDKIRMKSYGFIVENGLTGDEVELVLKWAEKNFPQEYKEAKDLATNPERKVVYVYRDQLDFYFAKKLETEDELNDLTNLLHRFLEDRNLYDEFQAYMKMINDEQEIGDDLYINEKNLKWFMTEFTY